MKLINYLDNKDIRNDIEPLFVKAFPMDERPPAEIYFSNFIDKPSVTTLYGCYLQDDTFVGFTSIILYKDICYIFFLAVKEELRNQGYGSKILSYIKDKYSNKVILLCYEEVDKKYKDYELRLSREAFYHRNGFKINPLKTNEFGVIFQTAYYGSHTVSFEEYKEIFLIGFGEYASKHVKKV